jgi:membrane associated rhomboid family serine protease
MSGFGGRPQLALPRFTPAVKAILIACGAVYLLELILVNWVRLQVVLDLLWLEPARVVHSYWVWQLFTYSWLHHPNDPSHLLFNLLGLWLVGAMLEQRWGTWPFVKFYLLTAFWGGVAVVLAYLVFGAEAPVLGASGAVDALMVGFGILYPDMPIWFFGLLPLKGKHFVVLLVGLQLLFAAARLDGVSIAAHLGGMAAGALLITGLWRPSRLRLRLFGPPKAAPKKRPPGAPHLRVVPGEDDDGDDRGGNGASKMLH